MAGEGKEDLEGKTGTRTSENRASFFSRKNRVTKSVRDGRLVVVKTFPKADEEAVRKEYAVLVRCREAGVPVPEPLAIDGNAIMMEFVDGKVLSSVLDSHWLAVGLRGAGSGPSPAKVSELVGSWLHAFHSAFDFGLRRGDVNMRNFILKGGEVFGIDFEESSEGDVIDDLGQACATVLAMDPMFTEDKFEFARGLVERYFSLSGADRYDDLGAAVSRALRYYASFRKDHRRMTDWASRIDAEGLPFSEG